MSEQEQFENLRVLLTLKRHEQPPPGYFDRLSRDIMAQIRADQAARSPSLEERIGWEIPWLQRFWRSLESKPVFAGGLGVAVCCLVLAGVAYNTAPIAAPQGVMPLQSFAADSAQSEPVVLNQALPAPVQLVPSMPAMLASTGGVLSLSPSPIRRNPYVLPAVDIR